MIQHSIVASNFFEIAEMPFYWRLSNTPNAIQVVPPRMPIRVVVDETYDYLKFEPNQAQWAALSEAYNQNENIGFVNPESGQLHTYGSSVNRFFLATIEKFAPKSVFEIGCGAGFTIQFLKKHGWNAIGVDPSEYSKQWSTKLDFPLINEFFQEGSLSEPAHFIYCNDVFEHVPKVDEFCALAFDCLADDGVFCFATTNSTSSIAIGDISMLEHQHVNMFTERSITLLLTAAGFTDIELQAGSYGNTFHVFARKGTPNKSPPLTTLPVSCHGYFERAQQKLAAFKAIYDRSAVLHCYVPLRCLPYLATAGDFGQSPIYDSNSAWRGRYIDGYNQPIRSVEDIRYEKDTAFFVGSLTFYQEIRETLLQKGIPASSILSIRDTE